VQKLTGLGFETFLQYFPSPNNETDTVITSIVRSYRGTGTETMIISTYYDGDGKFD
jgi:hypothetical protein